MHINYTIINILHVLQYSISKYLTYLICIICKYLQKS